ncbi:hypothetical protein B0T11DRAFT_355305 [Plectosphaerella cucumerina]|uniref:Uncharacterized protein n=1 Tax=Plectosphaerella cucumerina TaxID=40658 RepID=A0A8K0TBA3_9PEZI|nr:hypothetical protein B0T11DRAFT_355305 [Plectosphaerella cucumerina]
MHGLMHISLGLSLLGGLGDAAPAHHGQWTRVASRAPGSAGFVLARQATNGTAPPAAGATPSDTQLRNAVMGWMRDTGKVTNFLNSATSLTGDEYTRQAQIALNAEVDELNHKKILDAGLSSMPSVQAANEILDTQGNFQNVVTVLQNMVNNGPDTAQADVDAINNNRCVNVLPNIDAYFAAAGMPDMQSFRPTGCLEVAGAPTDVPPAPVVPLVPAGGAPPAAGNGTAPAAPATPASGNANAGGNNSNTGGNTGNQNNNNGGNNANVTQPPNNARASSSPLPTSTSSSTTTSRPANNAAAKATSSSSSSSVEAADFAEPTGPTN